MKHDFKRLGVSCQDDYLSVVSADCFGCFIGSLLNLAIKLDLRHLWKQLSFEESQTSLLSVLNLPGEQLCF